MSTDDGVSDDDEDFDEYNNDNGNSDEKRFPIHDACEFGDIDALRRIILEPIVEQRTANGDRTHHHHRHQTRQHHHSKNKNASSNDDDDDDDDDEDDDDDDDDDSDDESDENDSTAAAHAAATGHSPRVVVGASKAANSNSLAATATVSTIAQTASAAAEHASSSPPPSSAKEADVATTQADSSSPLQQIKASAAAAAAAASTGGAAAALADSAIMTPRISNASVILTSAAGAAPMPGCTGSTEEEHDDSKLAAKTDNTQQPRSALPPPAKVSENAVQEEEGEENMDTIMTDKAEDADKDTTTTTTTTLDSSSKRPNNENKEDEKQSAVSCTSAAAADVASPMDVDHDSPTPLTAPTTPTKDEINHVVEAAAASAATSPEAEEASPKPPTRMNEQVENDKDDDDDDDDDDDMPPPPRGSSPHKSTTTTKATRKVVYRVPMNINLNERDLDENTPLHVAIHARKLEHVKLLLELGASYRLRCDGSFPLHTAISMGAIRLHSQFAYECVVALHENGADLTLKDESNHTPLFLACMFNLPQICSFILSNPDGKSTLNARADRAGNRPLHAAAKYDTPYNRSITKSQAATATGQRAGGGGVVGIPHHHHPDGTVIPKTIPRFPGKTAPSARLALATSPSSTTSSTAASPADATMTTTTTTSVSSEALLTHVLLGTIGIEIDGINSLGQTALHVACLRGNWPVTRLLLQAGASPQVADRRGFTPGQLAYKRGMPIPADLVDSLGDPPESGVLPPVRDLIVDPNGPTLVLTHELCILHRTCPPVRRDSPDTPPENVRRLQVLVDADTGILRSGEFTSCIWKNESRRVAIGDVLRCHEYSYVESISQMASSIPDHPNAVANLDPDTTISRWSFEAAMRAAGSVCQAVDQIVVGDYRNAFCAVRPPGHHAGPRGIVKCPNDPEGGSHGFCLLNNVAIGAAYARNMYRNEGIRKVAIIDFDVHHGNGTEQIIRQLVPTTEKVPLRTPFAFGELAASSYRPWLDETDIHNVFFASTHGFGNRGLDQPGWFYPASGKTHTSESISHPAMVEHPNLTDFLLSQTWTRMGEDSKANCCKIINVGLELPDASSDPQGRSMKQRLDLRDTYRRVILPHLREFDPDLIFISAGFDAHRKDTMNFGYVGMVEDDYEWVTEQLVKIANTCCNGRVISVLEGGYKIHGGIVSPFARSVASHVRGLVDGGRSRELYDGKDMEWESQYERHIYERREKKKEEDREKLRLRIEASQRAAFLEKFGEGDAPEDPDAPSRKRRRNQVDYKELFKQMQQEGFANG